MFTSVSTTDLAGGVGGSRRRSGIGSATITNLAGGGGVQQQVNLVPFAMGSGLPPPPGFSPFVWPVDDGGMDVDDLCVQISGDCSLTLSPIGRVSSDVSDTAGSPDEGVLISPSADSSSEVGYGQ